MPKPAYRRRKGRANRHPWRTCPTQKISYPTRENAELATVIIASGPQRPYQCGRCGDWHLHTYTPKRGAAR
jgi:hypothetical protein